MMIVTEVDTSFALSRSEQQARYRQSNKGTAARAEQQKRSRQRKYLARPFMAWDGEGITTSEHLYTLFAYGNQTGARGSLIESNDGLATVECLDFMLEADTTDSINVIYGGNYDINMWLKDVDRDTLTELYNDGSVKWNGYHLGWRPGKQFSIRRRDKRFHIYDVLPFFQRTFVQACDEYLGEDWPYRDQIIDGKKRRGSFTEQDSENVKEYNQAELSLLCRLTDELRSRLNSVTLPTSRGISRRIIPTTDGIRLTRWDGPGAIATALYQKYETKAAIGDVPDQVKAAGRHAYAGGRFEIVRQGHSENRAWQYDINSAYPYTIQNLPCLAHGRWEHVQRPTGVESFGLYRINNAPVLDDTEWSYPLRYAQDWTRPQPLWYRTGNGRIVYGPATHNWFWSPEARLGLEHGARLEEAYEYVQECDHRPFEFVGKLYEQRAELKRRKDGAHVGIKLGLNSLYGKLAQQVGWKELPNGELRIPPYHCLEWAGYITASCRAMLYRAAEKDIDNVIAFETDAIFTREPLDLDIGTGLGQWEETRYRNLTYLMSGYYFGTLEDGTEVEKSRGVNKGSITREIVKDALRNQTKIPAEQTRFITLGQALHQDWGKWRQWITAPREMSTMINGKRIHAMSYDAKGCHARGDGWAETWPNTMLEMENAYTPEVMSKQYDIEWLGNTDYDRAADRRAEFEREYDE